MACSPASSPVEPLRIPGASQPAPEVLPPSAVHPASELLPPSGVHPAPEVLPLAAAAVRADAAGDGAGGDGTLGSADPLAATEVGRAC